MSLVSNNIKSLRKKHHYTQEQFAQKLGIKRSLLGAYEEARAKPRLEILVKAATLFNVSVDQLVAENLSHPHTPAQQHHFSSRETGAAKKVASAVILVGKGEQDRYFSSREDQDYLSGLPEIGLPMLNGHTETCRAFEMTDDAMWPVVPGTVVIGKREENLQALQDGQVYVVVTRKEGVLLRKVYNRIQEDGTLLLQASHPAHASITLSVLGKEVEVWEVLYYISQQIPFADEQFRTSPSFGLPELTALVLELQQEVRQLKEATQP